MVETKIIVHIFRNYYKSKNLSVQTNILLYDMQMCLKGTCTQISSNLLIFMSYSETLSFTYYTEGKRSENKNTEVDKKG